MSFLNNLTISENLIRLASKSDQSVKYATIIIDGTKVVGCGYNYGCKITSNLCPCLLCP